MDSFVFGLMMRILMGEVVWLIFFLVLCFFRGRTVMRAVLQVCVVGL